MRLSMLIISCLLRLDAVKDYSIHRMYFSVAVLWKRAGNLEMISLIDLYFVYSIVCFYANV